MTIWDRLLGRKRIPPPGIERIKWSLDRLESRHGANIQRNPVLTEEQIAIFEQRYEITLPEEYRRFLLEVGNGGIGTLLPLDETSPEPGDIIHEFPAIEYCEHVRMLDPSVESSVLNGTLAISGTLPSFTIRLIVTGPRRGQVWADYRNHDGPIMLVGNSFYEWYAHENPGHVGQSKRERYLRL